MSRADDTSPRPAVVTAKACDLGRSRPLGPRPVGRGDRLRRLIPTDEDHFVVSFVLSFVAFLRSVLRRSSGQSSRQRQCMQGANKFQRPKR